MNFIVAVDTKWGIWKNNDLLFSIPEDMKYFRDLTIDNIVIMGYSIGTGMATYLASQKNVNGLILLAPYDNALNLYNDNLNIFYGPIEKIRKYAINMQ